MELHEILNICLLALESRYPGCVIEMNGCLLGHSSSWEEARAPGEISKRLHLHAPQLLLAPALLVINSAKSAIYIIEVSEEEPAFRVYCGGWTPVQHAGQQTSQQMTV